jgi:hypothetical protein
MIGLFKDGRRSVGTKPDKGGMVGVPAAEYFSFEPFLGLTNCKNTARHKPLRVFSVKPSPSNSHFYAHFRDFTVRNTQTSYTGVKR